MSEPWLRVRKLRVEFGPHAAVDGVDLDLYGGETLGLVGESGSGKSSLARAIVRLVEVAAGTVEWRGENLASCTRARLRGLRRELQIVFQNPTGSLDPRMTVAAAVAEPLRIFEPQLDARARRSRVAAMLDRVGLDGSAGARYAHELSGGQCQRAAIARAMILNPKLLVCDEPVSALDVSIQGQIVNLLADLQAQSGTAMLFISHNLGVVRHLSQRIMVFYRGRCVELAARDQLFAHPLHPYTRALLAAASGVLHDGPVPAQHQAAQEAGPSGAALPRDGLPEAGCAYRNRCGFATTICRSVDPPLSKVAADRFAACHRAREFCDEGPVA